MKEEAIMEETIETPEITETVEGEAAETAEDIDIKDIVEEELEELAEKNQIDLDKLKESFATYKNRAIEMMRDDGEMEAFLVKLEQKMAEVPLVGSELKNIPVLASLVRSYVMKEYTLAPTGTMIAVVTALLYWVFPIDLIPDGIPGVGYLDDAVVVALCWKMVETDVELYDDWHKQKAANTPAETAAEEPNVEE